MRNLGRPITGTEDIDIHQTNFDWGILSPPVIDEATAILYACAWISQDGSWRNGRHFLAALHLADGFLAHPLLDLEGAVYAPPGLPSQSFVSAQRKQRAALTLTQSHVLIPFGTVREEDATAHGWLIAVDAGAWRIAATWCSTVTGSGGGIWQSGAGPAVAGNGSIFVITGNGAFGPDEGDFGKSIVKLRLPMDHSGRLTVVSWWTPFTDSGRSGGKSEGREVALPSNLQITKVLGHALRMGMTIPTMPGMTALPGATSPHEDDATIAPRISKLLAATAGADWRRDQDFGSGGPVLAEAAGAILAAGKDGILYTGKAGGLGDTQPADLAPERVARNYLKLLAPPILYTYFDPTIPPAPVSPMGLNKEFPGGATRHLHGAPVLWHSSVHGWMHFVGGENSPLRAWTLAADGTSAYQAASDEIASAQSPHPPGGMPGWSIAVAANGGVDGIIVAMVPYKDSNMTASPGRLLIYDAQNFARNSDGSNRLQILWDSEDWGPEHAFTHPKFNRPIVWNGRIYRPTYDGRVDVYGLAG